LKQCWLSSAWSMLKCLLDCLYLNYRNICSRCLEISAGKWCLGVRDIMIIYLVPNHNSLVSHSNCFLINFSTNWLLNYIINIFPFETITKILHTWITSLFCSTTKQLNQYPPLASIINSVNWSFTMESPVINKSMSSWVGHLVWCIHIRACLLAGTWTVYDFRSSLYHNY